MKEAKYKIATNFLIMVFIFKVLITQAMAGRAEFEMIKKIEDAERPQQVEVIVRPKIEYDAQGLRDPFKGAVREEKVAPEETRVPETQENPPPQLTIQGIIWGGPFPLGIINNKVLKVGDTIDGARIISIDKEGVTIFFEGMQYNFPSPAAAISGPSINPQGG